MYNFFPIKEVGDSPENDRRPASPTFHHHLNLSGDPPSHQENHQVNPIPYYHPPYYTAEYPGPLPPLVGPIYCSLVQPLPVGAIYYSLPRPLPYPQHGFLVVAPSYPQHGFAVVPPPTGPSYVGIEDEHLPKLTDQELWEIYDKFMEARRAKKRQGKKRRERRIKENEMGEVHST